MATHNPILDPRLRAKTVCSLFYYLIVGIDQVSLVGAALSYLGLEYPHLLKYQETG